jgi:hypothetical protein
VRMSWGGQGSMFGPWQLSRNYLRPLLRGRCGYCQWQQIHLCVNMCDMQLLTHENEASSCCCLVMLLFAGGQVFTNCNGGASLI